MIISWGDSTLMAIAKAVLEGLLVIAAFLALLMAVIAIYLRARGASLSAVIRFIPNLAGLIGALYRDNRVPAQAKVVLTALMAYLATPFDIIPDFIPLLGYLDDVVVAAVALDGLFNQIDSHVIADHWQGDPETLAIVRRTAHQLSFFVPAGLKRRLFAGPKPGDVDDDD